MAHLLHQRGFAEAGARGFVDLLVRVENVRLSRRATQGTSSQGVLKASSHDLQSILHMQLCTLFQLRSSSEAIASVGYKDKVDALTVATFYDQHFLSSSNSIVRDQQSRLIKLIGVDFPSRSNARMVTLLKLCSNSIICLESSLLEK